MEIKQGAKTAPYCYYKTQPWGIIQKEQNMHSKNWFELIKAMIMAGLGYLAGIFL